MRHRISRSQLAALLLLLSAVTDARAERVPDLYRAETIITGTEEPERSRGVREAFGELVVKLTGNAGLRNAPTLQPLRERAGEFVREIELEDRMRGIPIHDEQGTRERPHFLRVRFDPMAVDRALIERDIKLWPANRPLVAVWFAIRTPGEKYVLEPEGPKGYGQREVFWDTAQRIGLPIALAPHRQESTQPTADDIVALEAARVRDASARGEALLLGSITLTDAGYWDANWLLEWNGVETRWSLHNITFDTAIKDGLQRTTGILAGVGK